MRLKDGYFSVSFPGSESYCFRYVEAARECFNMDKGIEGEF